MSQPARFPFLSVAAKRDQAVFMPLMPLELRIAPNAPVRAQGLLDSGATVNVLPYGLGIRLGAAWENQKTSLRLTGNLAAYEARALLVEARVAEFAAVRLAFAWARADEVPLLLGQVNFFQQFDVCFYAARLQFEVQPASRQEASSPESG